MKEWLEEIGFRSHGGWLDIELPNGNFLEYYMAYKSLYIRDRNDESTVQIFANCESKDGILAILNALGVQKGKVKS